MVKFYVSMILNGRLTIDQVPAKWHDAVEEELEKIYSEQAQEDEPAVEETAEPAEENNGETDPEPELADEQPADSVLEHDEILDDEDEE